MMNTVVYFEIQSSNLEMDARFYQNVFGWKITKDLAMPIQYYRIETDGIQGALLERPAPAVPTSGTNAFTCSIEVADFDKTAEVILANSGAVALPKFAIPGRCWQGYFLDPSQNVFGIFEADEKALDLFANPVGYPPSLAVFQQCAQRRTAEKLRVLRKLFRN